MSQERSNIFGLLNCQLCTDKSALEEQCVKDCLESLVAAQEEFQKAWRHAQAHSPNLPEVSPIEASAAKKGLELSRTHACAEKTKIVRYLKALVRGRMWDQRRECTTKRKSTTDCNVYQV